MPGIVSVQASSDAWASVANQATTGLNEGWLPAFNSIDAAGTMLYALSPSSSQGSFYSTGDGTTGTGNGFFSLGRSFRVVQGAATIYGNISASVSTGGQTLVSFSTAIAGGGLSTATAIAAVHVTPFAFGSALAIGQNPAGSGAVRLESLRWVVARTYSNLGDMNLIRENSFGYSLGTYEAIQIGSGNSIALGVDVSLTTGGSFNGTNEIIVPNTWRITQVNATSTDFLNSMVTLSSGLMTLYKQLAIQNGGGVTATVGALRLPSSTAAIMIRNPGNTADDQVWPHYYTSNSLAADAVFSSGVAGTYNDGPSVTLGSAAHFLTGNVTFLAGNIGTVSAKLWDGVTVLDSAEMAVQSGSVTSIFLSGIASSSSIWKVSLAATAASTGNLMKASGTANGNPAKASTLTALKIG